MTRVIEDIRVNGKPMASILSEQLIGGSLKLSARSITAFDFTILDRPDLRLTGALDTLFRDGTTIRWRDYTLSLSEVRTGGGAKSPTVDVSATSDFVHSIKRETGGKSWGKTSVSAWAGERIRANRAKAVVQPGLGERDIERKEPEGNGTTDENTWDVLAEMAKQTGSWLFEYGDTIYLAKPTWLVAQPNTRRFMINWNSWTDHTDALTSAPEYSWRKDTKEWEGQEQLVIKAMDPGQGSTNPLSSCRPGDIVDFTGAASPSKDPLWLVVNVNHPLVSGVPVTITCWRAVDPPEILPKSDKGEGADGGSSAGVPTGPLGSMNWQGEQLKNATEIVKEGQRRNLPELALQMAVACSMGEASLRYTPYGDAAGPDSVGLFQQRDTWGPRATRLQPSGAAGLFFAALVKTDYRGRYDNGATALPQADTGPIYIGPGKSGMSASVAIHHVQINADPRHYAKFWADAQVVVKACIEAGKDAASGSAPSLTGPMGQRIESAMKAMEGKYIEYDGAFLHQCVDVGKKYVADIGGPRNFLANGNQFWMHPALMAKFSPVAAGKPMRKGDVVGWSGSHGAYPNGGVGHVAIYSHSSGGSHYFLSQNPGPARTQVLLTLGIQGMMRPKG